MRKSIKFARVFSLSLLMAIVSFIAGSEAGAEEDARFSGFVDVSYSDASGSFSTFSLDQIEVDIDKKLDDKLSLRADLQHGADGVMVGGANGGVEQGYLTYALGLGATPVEMRIGVFNAPIGFESLDPVDMYQFSHGLIFSNGLPSNFAGVMATGAPGGTIDFKVYYVNGWDVATDNNNSKTVGGRLGITPSKAFNIGLSYVTGAENAGNSEDKLTVLDLDLTVTAIENLTIGAEYNSGTDDKASAVTAGADAEWTAFSLMLNYGFSDKLNATFRYENFSDDDNTRLSDDLGGSPGNLGVAEERESLTIAAGYSLGEGAGMVFEYRTDDSDRKVFKGNTENDMSSFAVEFTYSF